MNLRAQSLPALMAALLVLTLSGCGKSPEQHLQEGRAYMEKADYKAAILELKSTLQEQPKNREARLLLGKAHLATSAYAEAEKELGKARELGASEDQTLPGLAKALLKQGKAKNVIELTVPVDGLGPQSLTTLQIIRAEAFLGQGNRPDAEQAMQAASKADAGNPELLLLKARLALSDKKLPEATQLVDAALQRDANFADALYLKAALLQQDGKSDEATKIYQQIITNDAKQFRAHLAIASLQLKKGEIDAADKSIQAAEKVAGQVPMVKYARGTLELQRGKLDKASSALLDVLRIMPDHLPTNLAYAIASYGLGNYEQSMKNAGKVLAATPDNLIAANILAGSQLKIGDVKGALKTLDPLLAKYTDDAKLLALAGEAYIQAKDYNKAMGYLDKAAELEPENVTIKTRQAAGHLATGDSNEALADLEKAASLSNKPGQADLALVMLHLKGKEYDKALQAIANLEKKLPNNPVTHNLRAAALFEKQDKVGARKSLEQALAIQPSFFPAAINLARLDIQDKKPDAARKRFENILAMDKNNVKAMLALADLAAAEKKEVGYVAWLEKAAKADPKSMEPRVRLVRHYLDKKENQKALANAKAALSANPESLQVLNLLGATQLATGDTSASINTYTRMTEMAKQSPDAFLLLALAQSADKQLGTARGNLKKALQLKPAFFKAQDALLRLELADKKPAAALQIALEIQVQQPKSPFGFDREADIHLSEKRYPQAIKAYEQALVKGAGSTGLIKLHRTLTLSNAVKTADERLSVWIMNNPEDLSVRSYAAEYYMASNRDRDAIAQYEVILKRVPQSVLALNNLANLYQRTKDSRALNAAEQAYKLAPDNPGVQDTLGWILIEQGQISRATELLGIAAAKAPKIGSIRYHHGVALNRTGKKAEARKELDAAVSSGQKFPELEDAKALLKSL